MAKSKSDPREPQSASAVSATTLSPKLYDADDANPSFARFYPEAEQLLPTGKGLEPLFNWLETPDPIAIVDFGARASKSLIQFDGSTGFFETAATYKAKIVLCFALSPEADSIGLLKELVEQLGKNVEWIIARSTFKFGVWTLWENSQTRQKLAEIGAAEIAAPIVDADAWTALDGNSLTAIAATTDKRLKLVERSHIVRWRKKYATEFEAAVAPIINTEGKTLFLVTGDKGGVGKSSFARALTDWLLAPQVVPVS